MRYLLVGFADRGRFDERRNDWEPDDEFDAVDAAIGASKQWLVEHPDGVVEVIQFGGRVGDVVALVTDAGVERIDVVPRKAKRPGRLDRWLGTRVGWTIAVLVFIVAGTAMMLFPDEMARRNTPPGFIRVVGVVTVGFFGSAMLARLVGWPRSRSGSD